MQALFANHRAYFDIARVGDPGLQAGANWVGHWYARNLRIFDRLVGISSDPKSRVLVIYGYGHAYLLTRFAEESGAFRVADPRRYLNQGRRPAGADVTPPVSESTTARE